MRSVHNIGITPQTVSANNACCRGFQQFGRACHAHDVVARCECGGVDGDVIHADWARVSGDVLIKLHNGA